MTHKVDRRRVMTVSAATMGSIAGCISFGNEDSSATSDSTTAETDETEDEKIYFSPVLNVKTVKTPTAGNIEISSESLDDDENRYTVEFENTGISGPILVELYWIDGDSTAPEPAHDKTVRVFSGETQTTSFFKDSPGWVDKFTFNLQGLLFAAKIENVGREGEAVIKLIDDKDDSVVQKKTEQFDEDETKTVELETDHTFKEGSRVTADPK